MGEPFNRQLQSRVIINKRGHNGNLGKDHLIQLESARAGFPKEEAPRYIRGMSRSQPGEEWSSSKSGSKRRGKKQQGCQGCPVWQDDGEPCMAACDRGGAGKVGRGQLGGPRGVLPRRQALP